MPRISALSVMFALLAGCPTEKETGESCPANTLCLSDANNFAYTGAIDVPSVTTASASDLSIHWEKLVEDLQCHGMDPATDVDQLSIIRFPLLGQDDVEQGLSTDDLDQADMNGYLSYVNDQSLTDALLSSFTLFGTVVDVTVEYTVEGGTYLMLLSTGTNIGVGTRMLTFLEPSTESDNTDVTVPNGCGILDFDADLASMTQAPANGAGPYTAEWGAITTDGHGQEIDQSDLDGLMLGFYAGLGPADLESIFLDLETTATSVYRMSLDNVTTADLSQAVSDAGAAFSGFSGDGTWILALRCSRCYNPAPPFLTVVAAE